MDVTDFGKETHSSIMFTRAQRGRAPRRMALPTWTEDTRWREQGALEKTAMGMDKAMGSETDMMREGRMANRVPLETAAPAEQ